MFYYFGTVNRHFLPSPSLNSTFFFPFSIASCTLCASGTEHMGE